MNSSEGSIVRIELRSTLDAEADSAFKDVDELLVPAMTYNGAVNGNDAVIGLAPSDGVNEEGCNTGSYIVVSV